LGDTGDFFIMLLVDMCCLVGDLVKFFVPRLGFGENFVGPWTILVTPMPMGSVSLLGGVVGIPLLWLFEYC
jgi:hypothetical protein